MGAKVLAIGGGKGGTGKSFVAVQLGIILAETGLRVVLVDADLHGANLHSFFGLEDPAIALDWILNAQGEPQRAVLPTGVKHLGLVAGVREEMRAIPSQAEIVALGDQMRALEADVVLWDVGSGCAPWQAILFEQADVGLLVTQPEPMSMEKEYRFLRHVYRWRLSGEEVEQSFPPSGWLPVPWLSSLARTDRARAKALQAQLRKAPLLVLLNSVQEPEERSLGEEWMAVLRRFFGLHGEAVGWLEYDERIALSIRHRRPVVLEYPEALWVEQMRDVSARVIRCIQRGLEP